MSATRISFVCLGNICRSPLAEGVFRHLADQAGCLAQFRVESAGIGDWHVGDAPDPRAQATARAHGLQLTSRARQFQASDFSRLDLVVALDGDVAQDLRQMAPTRADRAKIRLLREFDPQLPDHPRDTDLDVPDPYYGGPAVFEATYQMIERSSRRLLESLTPPP